MFYSSSHFIKSFDKPKAPLVVAFDHNCKICMKFAHLVKRFDSKKLITIDSAEQPQSVIISKIPLSKRMDKIYSASLDDKVYCGFETIVQIFKRIKILRFFLPFLYLIIFLKLDSWLYDCIAKSKLRKKCRKGKCDL